MNENPYAASEDTPESSLQQLIFTTRQIYIAANILNCVGILLLLFFSFVLFYSLCLTFAYFLMNDMRKFWETSLFSVFIFSLAFVGWIYHRVALALFDVRPNVYRKALVLSSILLIGFPLFTLLGGICIYKLRKYYPEYCTLSESAVSDE